MNESKPNAQKFLENFQQELRERAEDEEINFADDAIYGSALLLDAYLRNDFTVEEALQEFLDNSDIKLGVRYE